MTFLTRAVPDLPSALHGPAARARDDGCGSGPRRSETRDKAMQPEPATHNASAGCASRSPQSPRSLPGAPRSAWHRGDGPPTSGAPNGRSAQQGHATRAARAQRLARLPRRVPRIRRHGWDVHQDLPGSRRGGPKTRAARIAKTRRHPCNVGRSSLNAPPGCRATSGTAPRPAAAPRAPHSPRRLVCAPRSARHPTRWSQTSGGPESPRRAATPCNVGRSRSTPRPGAAPRRAQRLARLPRACPASPRRLVCAPRSARHPTRWSQTRADQNCQDAPPPHATWAGRAQRPARVPRHVPRIRHDGCWMRQGLPGSRRDGPPSSGAPN